MVNIDEIVLMCYRIGSIKWFFIYNENREDGMFKCGICGKEFETSSKLTSHDAGHIVRPVSQNPLTLMLTLPDGVSAGRWAAAEAFTEGVQELRETYPGRIFQYVPFTYSDGYLTAMLAIANPESGEMLC